MGKLTIIKVPVSSPTTGTCENLGLNFLICEMELIIIRLNDAEEATDSKHEKKDERYGKAPLIYKCGVTSSYHSRQRMEANIPSAPSKDQS